MRQERTTLPIACYAVLLGLGLLSIGSSRQTVLLTGRGWLRFTLIFLAIAALVGVRDRFSLISWLALAVAALALSWGLSATWLLFKPDRQRTPGLIEEALARVLVPFRRHHEAYDLLLGPIPLSLEIGPQWPGLQVLKFHGDWHQNKARLAAALLAKQFRGVLPPLTFRV